MSLRFRQRHVHRTVSALIEAELTSLGWVTAPINFSTVPMTFLEFQPDEAGKQIAANTVAVTVGNEPAALDQELGDGLRCIDLPLFVDVYGANQSIATAIASDIKRILEDRALRVQDYSAETPVDTSEWIELDKDDLLIERPTPPAQATDFRRFWRVVKTVVRIFYVES